MKRVAALTGLLLLTITMAAYVHVAADDADGSASPAPFRWLVDEIRRFATYPHTDRAYRLLAAGRLDEAKVEFERSLSTDPGDPDVRANYVVVLHRLGLHDEVVREAALVLEKRPAQSAVRLYRAMAHRARDAREAALEDLEAVAAVKDTDADSRALALTMAVDVAVSLGALDRSLRAAEHLVTLRPTVDHALRRSHILRRLGRLDEADAAIVSTLEATADAAQRARLHEARAELAECRSHWDRASSETMRVLEISGESPPLLRRLGRLAHARNDRDGAVRWFERAARASGNPEDLEHLAIARYAVADYRGAARELVTLVHDVKEPTHRHRVLVALGHAYSKLGQVAQAIAVFREAATLVPDTATLGMLAEALERGERYAEAAAALESITDADATGERHLKLGTLYTRLQRWDVAVRHLGEAAALATAERTKAEAYKQQGFIHYRRGRYVDARRAFEQVLAHRGSDVSVYMALGETCMRLRAYRDAVHYMERALALTDEPGRR